jgi:hypothetical protein
MRLGRDLPLLLIVCLIAGCAADAKKMAAQMELDAGTCRREAPNVVKENKDFCLTHVTQMREEREKSLPTVIGNVLGGVLTAAGTIFVGAI